MQNMQKQMKNVQSLHNWQFQSLKFQKLSKLVPGHSKNLKKSPKVLFNQKLHIQSFVAKFHKITSLVPILWKLT